jgi:hypothetical protein
MYLAQMHPDESIRADARDWLLSRGESKSGDWVELWCRLAVGASYLRESEVLDDDSMCSLGVVQLLHAIVRFETKYPLLARMAKEMAVEALMQRGRYEEAAKIFGGPKD